MIYIVFALIAAAAAIYLYLTESRHIQQAAAEGGRDRIRLEERQHSIKLSLKDIDYERSIGKMDDENFARLQNELLTEWEANENRMAQLPAETAVVAQSGEAKSAARCPSCKTLISVATARFCHACGHKLVQLLVAVLLLFAFTSGKDLAALDIQATVKNATTNSIHTAPLNIQLLKLEQGMQPVAAKNSAGGKVRFADLPAMKTGPYMLQTVYQGVTYSRVIAPNMPEPIDTTLEIFESTASAAKLRVRSLVELRRVEKGMLAGLLILFFINSDNRTFSAGKDGLSFQLPVGAEVDQASISVGSGASNIQWLKLSAQKTGRRGVYSVGQSVKPGERILQVMFHMPYNEAGTQVEFQSLYPQDTGLQLIAEPENLTVKQGDKTLTRTLDENLGRGLISFSPRDAAVVLSFSGGGIAEFKKAEETAEIEVKSPLQLWQKLVFPVVAVLIFVFVAWLRGRQRIES